MKKYVVGSLLLIAVLIFAGWDRLLLYFKASSVLVEAGNLSKEASRKNQEEGLIPVELLSEPYPEKSADPECAKNYFRFRELKSMPDRPPEVVELYCACIGSNLKVLSEDLEKNPTDDVMAMRKMDAIQKGCVSRHLGPT